MLTQLSKITLGSLAFKNASHPIVIGMRVLHKLNNLMAHDFSKRSFKVLGGLKQMVIFISVVLFFQLVLLFLFP